MKRRYHLLIFLMWPLVNFGQMQFSNTNLQLSIDAKGKVTSMINPLTLKNYIDVDSSNYLLTIFSKEQRIFPRSVVFNRKRNLIEFKFPKCTVQVKYTAHSTHLSFETVKAMPLEEIDAVMWGPVFTRIKKTVGEIVGVVRDDDSSVGMLLCNAKTIGGYYSHNGTNEGRGSLAQSTTHGSSFQSYSINRDRHRWVDALQLKDIPVAPINGETVVGSKISFFCCDEPSTLDRIEKIILAEKLPHPTYQGVWTKKIFSTSRSYLISDFKESNIDTIINYAVRGGFFGIYHEAPFKTWGHFELDSAFFPNGKGGLKLCVDKAKASKLTFGVHVLTNFITENDAYVQRLPDHRLANTGYGLLTKPIDEKTNEIPVSTNIYYKKDILDNMHTIRIGNELIKYKAISENPPYRLVDCERGAFQTVATAHRVNDTAYKLADHPYMTFFPNFLMQREITRNLATLLNETGINHLDYDGHEGTYASGEGDYAYSLFAEDMYRHVNHEFINGTSNSRPYYWYLNTLCNWGEPWYGGFKQSMQDYRISNQALLERNYQPNMLGWYLLTKNTTLPEMEWMLARSAGWNAGFAMVTNTAAIKQNIQGIELLDIIREWEAARLSQAFNAEQRELLKNSNLEFHLENIGQKTWNWFQMESTYPHLHQKIKRQPGEPTNSVLKFENNSTDQPLRFTIENKGNQGSIKNLKLVINSVSEIIIPNEMLPGETIVCDATTTIRLYDIKGKQKAAIDFAKKIPTIHTGPNKIIIDALFTGDDPPSAELIVRTLLPPKIIKGK